jgi:WD40 repeat protein
MTASILRRAAVGFTLIAATACEISTGPDDGTTPSGFSLLIERRNSAGQRSFYMMSPDGKRVTPFVGAPADARALMPSPDGKTIAYLRDADAAIELWAMDRDGANRRSILAGAYVIESASWSPDGKSLVLAYSTATISHNIATISADGTGFRDLTPDPLPGVVIDRDPSWSPDGTRIAYSSNASGTRRLWIMNADGTSPHQVLASSIQSTERNPVWAPDTTGFLAVIATTAAGTGVALVRADGSDFKHIPIAAGPNDLAWLPDGRLIYIANPTGDYDVWTVDRVTGATTQVTTRRDNDLRAVAIKDVAAYEWLGFNAATTYQINRPIALDMAVGDVLTDGRPDLLILTPILNEIRLMKGSATGSMQSVGALFAETDVAALRIGSVSTDNNPDIVGRGDSAAYVWRGRADGPGISTRIAMNGILRDVAVTDLDLNGRADIVSLVETTNLLFRLKTHTANTSDNFVFASDLATTRTNGRSLCAGDLNGDARPDLAIFAGSANLSAFFAEGRGELGVADPVPAGANVAADLQAVPVCADFTNDGTDDVALFSAGAAQSVSILRMSSGTFGSAQRISAAASAVAYADIDRDGDLDVIMASTSTAALLVAKNRGSGTFDTPVSYTIPNIGISIAAGDFNGDNWPDVAVVDVQGALVVLMSKGRTGSTGRGG